MNTTIFYGVRFQFLGIPPKGEQDGVIDNGIIVYGFQFLGIPPKGEHQSILSYLGGWRPFRVSNF